VSSVCGHAGWCLLIQLTDSTLSFFPPPQTIRLRQVGLLRQMPQFPFPVPTPSELRPLGCPRLRISRSIPASSPNHFAFTVFPSLLLQHFPPPPTPPASIGQLITAGASLRTNFQRIQQDSHFGRKVHQASSPNSLFFFRPFLPFQALSLNRASAGQPVISLLGGSSQQRASTSALSFGLPSHRRTLRPPPKNGQQKPWVDRDIRQTRQAKPPPPARGTDPIIGWLAKISKTIANPRI
jgi:hypothetical protein